MKVIEPIFKEPACLLPFSDCRMSGIKQRAGRAACAENRWRFARESPAILRRIAKDLEANRQRFSGRALARDPHSVRDPVPAECAVAGLSPVSRHAA